MKNYPNGDEKRNPKELTDMTPPSFFRFFLITYGINFSGLTHNPHYNLIRNTDNRKTAFSYPAKRFAKSFGARR
jgi:hypothetical protein